MLARAFRAAMPTSIRSIGEGGRLHSRLSRLSTGMEDFVLGHRITVSAPQATEDNR